jgi:predicted transcriptional regulator
MVRTTSIIAYNDLKSSGKQPTQKEIILDALRKNKKPMSLQEICDRTNMQINSVSGRVNDLKRANQVVEGPTRKCTITRKTITPVKALRF